MSQWIQCVPNFSEGRRIDVIEEIVREIENASNVKVVDYSWDVDHNRSVITFIGFPCDILKSMIAGAEAAIKRIDMNVHHGEHPRIGAIDVVPVVPLKGITLDEAVSLSHEIGQALAKRLSIPVYFYEASATEAHKKNLPDIRKGGFEVLKETELTGNRAPDLGPNKIHSTAGAVVVGARTPLVAYNVNLATDDLSVAKTIASKIRSIRELGRLVGVRAIAVALKSRGIVQVSTNITRPDLVSMWDVYSFVENEAKAFGADVLESELIGAVRNESALGASPDSLKLIDFNEKRILDNWIEN